MAKMKFREMLHIGLISCFSIIETTTASFTHIGIPSILRRSNHKYPQWKDEVGFVDIIPRGGSSRTTKVMSMSLLPQATPLILSTKVLSASNALGLVVSLLTGSHLHLDLIGTGAIGLAAAVPLLSSAGNPQSVLLSSSAVILWSVKLASFLLFRATKLGNDARLDVTLSTVGGAVGFWAVSFIWGLVCSLPHTLGSTMTSVPNVSQSSVPLVVGSLIYALGLATETVSDLQKWNFKQSNPGIFCDTGLWAISQHPNFFGNLLVWSGILIMNLNGLIDPPSAMGGGDTSAISSFLSLLCRSRRLLLALLSPLFMWTLFSGQATGSITNSLEAATKKYGSDPNYQKYIKEIPLIVPDMISWLGSLFGIGGVRGGK